MSERLAAVTARLTALSIDSHRLFAWPARADADALAMSEELLPLAGHPLFASLSDEQRWQLALLEAVNFFSLNIAGEHELTAGLAQRITSGSPFSGYLRHFLDEEDAHTAVFSRFCLDYGGRIYPDRQLCFPRNFIAGEEEFLFFARVLVFEEIAHDYNRRLAGDDGVWKLAREINEYHASDETRHIAFGRVLLSEMWARFSPLWSEQEQKEIAGYIRRYMASVLRSYVNPEIYRELDLPATTRDEILASSHWQSLSDRSTRRVSQWLQKIGVFSP